jgi:hypothetical protein
MSVDVVFAEYTLHLSARASARMGSLDKQSVPRHSVKSKMFCTRLYLPVIISHLSEREGCCYDFQVGTLRTSLFGRERSPEHSASYLDF